MQVVAYNLLALLFWTCDKAGSNSAYFFGQNVKKKEMEGLDPYSPLQGHISNDLKSRHHLLEIPSPLIAPNWDQAFNITPLESI